MARVFLFTVLVFLAAGVLARAAAQPMSMMMTVGCVERDGRDRFILTRSTEPTALKERAPDEPPADAPLGGETITLIGTLGEFSVASHDGHKVWVKGLLNPGEPHRLLNVVSLTHLSPTCE